MEARQIRVANKYLLKKRIGGGSFGEIYRGTDIETNEDIAIKLEKTDCSHPQVLGEAKIIKQLKTSKGVPKVHWFGTEGLFNIMVIDLLGASLEDAFVECHRQFSLKTTVQLASQMISRIEHVHSRDYLHRDIKPDNYLMGREDKANIVYIIDFGLSKRYRDVKTKQHIPYKEGKTLTGTARYASVGSHMGIEQGRKDDIEAIVYVIIYFLLGQLPWQGIHVPSKQEKYHRICDMKMNMNASVLKGQPQEFLQLLTYAKALKFEDRPDYEYIQTMLQQVAQREEIEFDGTFDWTEDVSPQPPPSAKQDPLKKQRKKTLHKPRDNLDVLVDSQKEASSDSKLAECASGNSDDTRVVKGKYPALDENIRLVLKEMQVKETPQLEEDGVKIPERSSCRVF